jgi:muramidase (phage lysozyme)
MADGVRDLLDKIGNIESAKGYNYEFGNKAVPLDKMTIGEVLDHQKKRRKAGAKSSAIGRYQFIYKTLEDITRRNPKDFPLDTMFTPDVQDRAATVLLKRRGLDDYTSGNIDENTFAKNLSKEWASLPDPETGASYYDKDGLNKSLVDVDSVLQSVRRTKKPSPEEQQMMAQMLTQRQY